MASGGWWSLVVSGVWCAVAVASLLFAAVTVTFLLYSLLFAL
jgi:hypothetical protein